MNKLSVSAQIAWQIAAGEAAGARHQYIEKEHIFIGICSIEKLFMPDSEKDDLSPQIRKVLQEEHDSVEDVLRGFEFDMTLLRREVRVMVGEGNYKHTERVVHRSEACKKVFNCASELASSIGEISCLHLLAAILEEPGNTIRSVLDKAGVKPEVLHQRVLDHAAKVQKPDKEQKDVDERIEKVKSDTPYHDRYGRNLTREAREGKLGPFKGRRKELLQVIQTLARRSKNNPVLVGEAGVGKTAIVEALAIRITQGKDPQVLEGKRIVELNIGALMGGTKYRGEFEQRLTRIIEEARTHHEVIVFIDEIHNVVGAGRAEGSMDAANILKPALARGDIRCIGATTIAEYRRYIESDSALERRFEKVIVNEPGRNETVEMLKEIRPKWEEHYGIKITVRALEVAVDLSIRFDTDHRLPDKAIDLVVKAGAQTIIPILSMKLGRKGNGVKLEEGTGSAPGGGEVTELTIAEVLSEKVGIPLEVVTGHLKTS
ncbi:MAG: negative regulator of genetic competence ClpC/MecB [Candidatus Scalindua rubra]|uniref:Negative regulator of genetic competence ClpC/MecB n=1 Tax=Candidatus Scalindua rubra TaxID=1872076 RepID=A0A1E3X8V4_9BACT|nr:MAG: negative regulator of genetic competence ClpC/MecB [Candidatus Scalindua rubra]